MIEKRLSATDRERRHQDLAALLYRALHQPAKFRDGFRQWAMITISVSRFQKDQAPALQAGRVAEDRRIAWSDIAGKNDHPLHPRIFQSHLDTGGTQNMPSFKHANRDSRSDGKRLFVGERFEQSDNAGDVLCVEQWLH